MPLFTHKSSVVLTIQGLLDLQLGTAGHLEVTGHSEVTGQPAAPIPRCALCESDAGAAATRCEHCDKLVCEACQRSHSEQIKVDVGAMMSQIRSNAARLADRLSCVEHRSNQLQQQVSSAKAEVKDTIERSAGGRTVIQM